MINIFFDGGCYISNPGAAAGAAVLYLANGDQVISSKFLNSATNNVAEFTGLIVGLGKALELNHTEVQVFGDSQLVVNQVNGLYRCNLPHLRDLRDAALTLKRQFTACTISWVPRAQNAAADAAATQAINDALGLKPIRSELAESLPVCPPAEGLEHQIAKLTQQGSGGKFKSFLSLKVPGGRDRYSKMKFAALKQQLSQQVFEALAAALSQDESMQAKVMRWYLRGLPLELAIRKVEIDTEVSANMTRSKTPTPAHLGSRV